MNYTSIYRLNDLVLHNDFDTIETWEFFVTTEDDLKWASLLTMDGREVRKYWPGYPMQICHDIGPVKKDAPFPDIQYFEEGTFLPKDWWKFWKFLGGRKAKP